MKIHIYVHQALSSDIAKFYIRALVTFIAAVFAIIQWGLPLYWERSLNFKVAFLEGANKKYIQAEPLKGEPEQCLISGSVEIKNNSKSPLFVNNTYVFLIPYSVGRCHLDDEKCVTSLNMPPLTKTNGKRLAEMSFGELSEFHRHTINPLEREQNLFSGGTSWRPFSLLVPTKQIYNERMVVLTQQEFGHKNCIPLSKKKSWYQKHCNSARKTISVSWPCFKATESNNLDKKEPKKSEV